MTIHRIMGASAAVALLLAATIAAAQAPAPPASATPPPVRLRGTIDSVDGSTLNVTTRDGSKAVVKLADNGTVVRRPD